MNKRFSIGESVRQGIIDAWKCKWTLLEIALVAFMLFLGFFVVISSTFWLFDIIIGKHIALFFISIVRGFKSIALFVMMKFGLLDRLGVLILMRESLMTPNSIFIDTPAKHFVICSFVSLILAVPVFASFIKYFYQKTFFIHAKRAQGAFFEMRTDWAGFLQVFLVKLFLTLPLLIIAVIIRFTPVWGGITLLICSILFFILILFYVLRLRFASCFIIDQNMSALEAIKASYRLSCGSSLLILGYLSVYWIFTFVGMIGRFIVKLILPADVSYASIIAFLPVWIAYSIADFIIYSGWNATDVYVYRKLQEKPEQ